MTNYASKFLILFKEVKHLKGIGNFEDPSGTPHEYGQPQLPTAHEFEGITGFYGQVGPQTHVLYENYPAPGVAAARIIADLDYTTDPAAGRMWDLPQALRPAVPDDLPEGEAAPVVEVGNEGDGLVPGQPNPDADSDDEEEPAAIPVQPRLLPTANLIGWQVATRLTNEQRQNIENSGITVAEGFAADYPRFALNQGLFTYIGRRIASGAEKYKTIETANNALKGSLVQCPYVEKEPVQAPAFS